MSKRSEQHIRRKRQMIHRLPTLPSINGSMSYGLIHHVDTTFQAQKT